MDMEYSGQVAVAAMERDSTGDVMRVDFDFGKCILCLVNKADTWEHIIPRFIGGRLQLQALCSECNSTCGSKLVAGLRSDPSIRLALENLKDRLPDLYRAAQEGLPYVGQEENGTFIRLSFKDGKARVIPGPGPDDSTILDPKDARKQVKRRLEKQQLPEDTVQEYVDQFEAMEDHDVLPLPGGTTLRKGVVPSLTPDFSTGFVDDRLAALIAYEYVAFLVGNGIYDQQFDGTRRYIAGEDAAGSVEVERCGTQERQYDTWHSLEVERTSPELVIWVRFFRYFIFRVNLLGVDCVTHDPVYYEDVERGISLLAPSRADAREGRFIRLTPG